MWLTSTHRIRVYPYSSITVQLSSFPFVGTGKLEERTNKMFSTIRVYIAYFIPFFDGNAPGRRYSSAEIRRMFEGNRFQYGDEGWFIYTKAGDGSRKRVSYLRVLLNGH